MSTMHRVPEEKWDGAMQKMIYSIGRAQPATVAVEAVAAAAVAAVVVAAAAVNKGDS